MEKPVEDCCGEDLVAGKHPGPVADALVGGDEGRASSVAVGDEAEEQARLEPGHGLEADLVDDEEGRRHVLAAAKPLRAPLGVALERSEEILESVEDHGEAAFDGPLD